MVCFRYVAINTLHNGDKYNNNNNNNNNNNKKKKNVIIKLLSSSFFLHATHTVSTKGGLHITTRHTLRTVTVL